MADDSPEKRARVEGTMPADLREKIENALDALGDVEFKRRSHHKRGPIAARILPDEDLVHEKGEIVRQGAANRIHYVCSNDKCREAIRSEKWNDHVLRIFCSRKNASPRERRAYRTRAKNAGRTQGERRISPTETKHI